MNGNDEESPVATAAPTDDHDTASLEEQHPAAKPDLPPSSECDKLSARSEEYKVILEFLEFANEKGLFLAEFERKSGTFGATTGIMMHMKSYTREEIAQLFLEVDPEGIKREREALLMHLRTGGLSSR